MLSRVQFQVLDGEGRKHAPQDNKFYRAVVTVSHPPLVGSNARRVERTWHTDLDEARSLYEALVTYYETPTPLNRAVLELLGGRP